jgi:guanine nucleotide-binding protein subunit alpha
VSADAQLADRLSGGITVSGSGKGGVYVRSGWQARTIENALGRLKPRHAPHDDAAKKATMTQDAVQDILVEEVGRMLTLSKDDIKELWSHPTVRGLIARRKLKLDEWSE